MYGKSPYNALMGSKKLHPFWLECLDRSKEAFYEKLKIDVYKIRKCRFVCQTTGCCLIKRVLKNFTNHKLLRIVSTKTRRKTGKISGTTNLALDPYFYDTNDFSWNS